jgi:hypothetical protein
MALSSHELDKIAADIYNNRLIGGSTYCGVCGYNLRTLPYQYRCPECGNEYNARPLTMKGIFLAGDAELPVSDVLGVAFFGVAAFLFVQSGLNPPSPDRLLIGAAFLGLTIYHLTLGGHRIRRYLRARAIARRIRLSEQD